MTLPFPLPEWLPSWAPVLVLVPGLLWALAFLLMPFSVFGVKGRLDSIEARLDEIQGEIRTLALRMPEPTHRRAYDDVSIAGPGAYRMPGVPRAPSQPAPTRPPIPPVAHYPDGSGDDPAARSPLAARRVEPARVPSPPDTRPQRDPGDRRAEPRIDWPR